MTGSVAEPGPGDAAAWGRLGDRLRLEGDGQGADRAYLRQIRAALSDPELLAAADALDQGAATEAHRRLSAVLERRPDDAVALRMFADLAARSGRHNDAEALLAKALETARDLAPARAAYALALHQQGKSSETIAQTDILLAANPDHPLYRQLRAAALMRVSGFEEACDCYAAVVAQVPDLALTWMAYGHSLKTLGRQGEAIAAYREALRLRPGLGEAWWSLANLKSAALGPADIAAMESELASATLSDEDRYHLRFALGQAYEDAGADEQAFRSYQAGNALRRAELTYDPDETSLHASRCKALLSRSFFAARQGQGSPRPDPIFIVGLPRSGSTLVDQILASHSQVEGTQELPDLEAIAARLGGHVRRGSDGAYPDILAALSPAECVALGEEYLRRAQIHRHTQRPLFIDKTPNNFSHIGLIQLILPQAKIIDVRRHPVGCCLSAFKQHFAAGQAFSYSLADLARYYRDYVELMAHFDEALPGRVHRVFYESLVAEPEAEVRRLLDHCGLPFEAACLRFYETRRAVRTPSSEQVRRPIFTEATLHWRRFEPFLDELTDGLGEALLAYPAAPAI